MIEYLQSLNAPDVFNSFVIFLVILVVIQGITKLLDWFIERLGLETKSKRLRREKEVSIENQISELVTDVKDIKVFIEDLKSNDVKQNKALVETMRDRLLQRCRYYNNVLHGIPENELGSLIDELDAYEAIGGNHGVRKEVDNCVKKLPLLSVTISKVE